MERGRERGRRAFAAASRPKAAGFSWYAVSDDVRWVKKKWVAWSILVAMCLSSCATADDKGVAETGSPVAEKDDTRCEVYRRSLFALNDGQWTVVGDGVRMFPCQKAICAQDDGRFDWHWVAPASYLGDMTAAYKGTIVLKQGFFEINREGQSREDGAGEFDIILENAQSSSSIGVTNLFEFGKFSAEHTIPLDSSGNWVHMDKRSASDDSILQVLSSVSSFKIRGGRYFGPESSFLSHVDIFKASAPRRAPTVSARISSSSSLREQSAPLQVAGEKRKGEGEEDADARQGVLEGGRGGEGLTKSGFVVVDAGGGWGRTGEAMAVVDGRKRKREEGGRREKEKEERERAERVEEELQERRAGRTKGGRGEWQGEEEEGGEGEGAREGEGDGGGWREWGERACRARAGESIVDVLVREARGRGGGVRLCVASTRGEGAFGVVDQGVLFVRGPQNGSLNRGGGGAGGVTWAPLERIESMGMDERGNVVLLGEDGEVVISGSGMGGFDAREMASLLDEILQAAAPNE